MKQSRPVIGLSYRADKKFRDHLIALLDLPGGAVTALGKAAREFVKSGHDISMVTEDLARENDLDAADLYGPFSVMLNLVARVAETDSDPKVALNEVKEVAAKEALTNEIQKALLAAFSLREEDRTEILARKAFATGATYVSSELHPSLRLVGSRLTPGLQWTLQYYNEESDSKSISLGLSRAEARKLLEEFQAALRDLDRMPSGSTRGGRPE